MTEYIIFFDVFSARDAPVLGHEPNGRCEEGSGVCAERIIHINLHTHTFVHIHVHTHVLP